MRKLGIVLVVLFCFVNSLLALNEKNLRQMLQERRRRILANTEKNNSSKKKDKVPISIVSEKKEKDLNKIVWEWGGWQDFSYIGYDNDDKKESETDVLESLWNLDSRIWVKAKIKHKDTFYLRLKNSYYANNFGPGVAGDESQNSGIDLDMLYYKWKFANSYLTLGRQYFRLGRGVVYSSIDDGISYNLNYGNLRWKAFYSKTTGLDYNLDSSSPYEDNREFIGLEGRWTVLDGKHTLYGYGLWTQDNVDYPASVQSYFYEPSYFGVGAEGSFFKRSYYWFEYMRESGSMHSYGKNFNDPKDDISAWALYSGSMYFLKGKTKPYFIFEYLMGSGDKDAGITDSKGVKTLYPVANQAGTDAKTFTYFGYVDIGGAFGSDFSNLKVSRVGFFFSPFGKNKYHRAVTMGIKYSDYKKIYAESPVDDYYSDQLSRDVGTAWDFYCNWQLLDDLNLYVNYSVFSPGNAYRTDRRDDDKYLYASLSLSF
jgi:hypothetical protein